MNMISSFPKFDPLGLKAQADVNSIVNKLPPYSDFNFISLFSWNVKDDMQISLLNENLVVFFKDYTSDRAFLSFIGERRTDTTIRQLLDYAVKNNLPAKLHLVPEHVVKDIEEVSSFLIEEDRDSHDYIINAQKLSELEGKKYAGKRHGTNKFLSRHEDKRIELKHLTIDEAIANEILQTFQQWRKESGKTREETADDLKATDRLLKNASQFKLNVLGVYIDGAMVAYSIYEILSDYAMGHFEAASKSYPGLYDFLKHSTAKDLYNQGVKYINYEQDLGIEGLRQAKLLLHPERFLKKYSVSLK